MSHDDDNTVSPLAAVLFALDAMPTAESEAALLSALKPELKAAVEAMDLCLQCGKLSTDHYMVQDEVWTAVAGAGSPGLMDLDCVEQRLGRPLVEADFTDAPINAGIRWGLRRRPDAG